MDPVWLAGALVTVVGGAVTWWVNVTWRRVDKIERDLTEFRIKVAGEYVKFTALREILQPIMDELKKIDEKLDQKADKPK